jgi:gliding motility-associated-like protein
VVVTVNPLPTIVPNKSNDVACGKPTAQLGATGAVQYTWDASPTLNASTNIAIVNPNINTSYTVTGIDVNGCKNKASIIVFVNKSINKFDVPNSFTPNGDTKNDCFGIVNGAGSQDVFFIIYNRWGEKVFETNNASICWDGNYKGSPAGEGNYVYYIRAKTNCGDVLKKGNVLLIR